MLESEQHDRVALVSFDDQPWIGKLLHLTLQGMGFKETQ